MKLNSKVLHRKVLLSMKLSIILLLAACMQVSAHVNAQSFTYSKKHASFEEVFKAIREQTGYEFLYNTLTLGRAKKLDLHFKRTPVEKVLNTIFRDEPFSYTVIGKTIVVNEKTVSLKDVPSKSILSLITIHGVITDAETGKPLIGVTIQVKNSTMGTTTGSKGNFSLEAPDNAVLIISYLGYNTKEIPVNGKNVINITLSATTTGLNQLVVVGYGTQKKASLTSAVSSIQGKEIITTPNENVENMLTGKVAGLYIQQNTAEPGDFSNNISIRGLGHPLIVIDGVEMPDFNVTGGNGD
ncbi:MAG: SusC/RagA family TonB-linked outer membrane protein, partial [Chitinophagaceae bacterium]